MWLFLAFLAVPLIEIALFIQIGGAIGLGSTLVIVVLTAVLGTWLVRNQGLMVLSQVRGSFSQMQDPTEPLANGAMILFFWCTTTYTGVFHRCGWIRLAYSAGESSNLCVCAVSRHNPQL